MTNFEDIRAIINEILKKRASQHDSTGNRSNTRMSDIHQLGLNSIYLMKGINEFKDPFKAEAGENRHIGSSRRFEEQTEDGDGVIHDAEGKDTVGLSMDEMEFEDHDPSSILAENSEMDFEQLLELLD